MSQSSPPPAHPPAGPRLVATDLTRTFRAVAAVQRLSFEVDAGELYGLVGPDGAGKTTTIRLLTGLLLPDQGEARVLGQRVADGGTRVREALGYMPQQYSLYGDLSILENLEFFGRLFGMERQARRTRQERLLEITRLGRFRDRRADALSGGMYKKLALACALLHQPQVLLLDEPTNGVDPVSRRELWDLLHEFVAEGMAVLLATPYMDEAARCHRVGLLHQGRLLAQGDPAALVRGFVHTTLLLHTDQRDAAEAVLHGRPELLALSPQGAALRVVVHRAQEAPLLDALTRAGIPCRAQAVAPDFEDVFLGLLADPAAVPAAARVTRGMTEPGPAAPAATP